MQQILELGDDMSLLDDTELYHKKLHEKLSVRYIYIIYIYDHVMGAFKVRLFKEDDMEKGIQLGVGALRLILIIFPKLDVIVEKYKNTDMSDSIFRFQIADMTFVIAGKNVFIYLIYLLR